MGQSEGGARRRDYMVYRAGAYEFNRVVKCPPVRWVSAGPHCQSVGFSKLPEYHVVTLCGRQPLGRFGEGGICAPA